MTLKGVLAVILLKALDVKANCVNCCKIRHPHCLRQNCRSKNLPFGDT